MWRRHYKDYPIDTPLKKECLKSGKGIVGCEMHEQMGWGENFHIPQKNFKIGLFKTLLQQLFGDKR